ncbi:MAG: hypothetical protein ACK501_18330 [Planctomycetota bacterium]
MITEPGCDGANLGTIAVDIEVAWASTRATPSNAAKDRKESKP